MNRFRNASKAIEIYAWNAIKLIISYSSSCVMSQMAHLLITSLRLFVNYYRIESHIQYRNDIIMVWRFC